MKRTLSLLDVGKRSRTEELEAGGAGGVRIVEGVGVCEVVGEVLVGGDTEGVALIGCAEVGGVAAGKGTVGEGIGGGLDGCVVKAGELFEGGVVVDLVSDASARDLTTLYISD